MGWVNPRAIGWARRQVVGAHTQKLVLLVLASYCTTANDCQVTVEALARDCEIDERTVQRALRSLAQRQLITIRPRFREGRNRPNTYVLNLTSSEGGSLPPRGGADDTATPAADPNQGGAGATPTTTTALSIKQLLQLQPQPPSGEVAPSLLPATLDKALRARAQRLLARAPPTAAQDVADEWIARWREGALRNPLAYLSKLVKQAEAGRFYPELAEQERAKRKEEIRRDAIVAAPDPNASPMPGAGHTAKDVKWIVQDLAQRLRYQP